MITFALGFVIGAIAIGIYAFWKIQPKVDKGHYASALYDEKKKEWRVTGRYLGINNHLVDIREGRKPGVIKYVD